MFKLSIRELNGDETKTVTSEHASKEEALAVVWNMAYGHAVLDYDKFHQWKWWADKAKRELNESGYTELIYGWARLEEI